MKQNQQRWIRNAAMQTGLLLQLKAFSCGVKRDGTRRWRTAAWNRTKYNFPFVGDEFLINDSVSWTFSDFVLHCSSTAASHELELQQTHASVYLSACGRTIKSLYAVTYMSLTSRVCILRWSEDTGRKSPLVIFWCTSRKAGLSDQTISVTLNTKTENSDFKIIPFCKDLASWEALEYCKLMANNYCERIYSFEIFEGSHHAFMKSSSLCSDS